MSPLWRILLVCLVSTLVGGSCWGGGQASSGLRPVREASIRKLSPSLHSSSAKIGRRSTTHRNDDCDSSRQCLTSWSVKRHKILKLHGTRLSSTVDVVSPRAGSALSSSSNQTINVDNYTLPCHLMSPEECSRDLAVDPTKGLSITEHR
jgi:hypothetical protein